MSSPENRLNIGISCFLAALFYAWWYGRFGYSDTDYGFIQALSWRILNGEIPYLDFVYVRPPLTPYLHAAMMWILPDSLEGIGERCLFYFFIASSVYLTTRTLIVYFDFREIGLSPSLFALMAFVLSVHNFPPMAWHTVDGILFASAGLNLIGRKKSPWLWGLGLCCLLGAAMCKQAFYPMVLVGPLLMILLHGKRGSQKTLIYFLVGLVLAILTSWMLLPDWFAAMLSQITGSTSLDDLIETGVVKYIKPFFMIVLPLLVIWRVQYLYKWRNVVAALFWSAFLGLLFLHMWNSLKHESYIGPGLGFGQAFFLLGVGIALKGYWVNGKAFAILLAMLALSWCVSLSWGYQNPLLYFTPILFAFIYGLYEELDFMVPRYFYGIICLGLIWLFGAMYQYPYRDAARKDIHADMGTLHPRLNHIWAGDEMYQKTAVLKTWFEKLGSNLTVLPAFPQAHYLNGLQNPLSVDWAHNAEIQGPEFTERLSKELENNIDYVLIQKDKMEEIAQQGKYGSDLSETVLETWTLYGEDSFFMVFHKKNHAPAK